MPRQTRMACLSFLLGAAVSSTPIAVLAFSSTHANAQAATQVQADAPDQFEIVSIKAIDPALLASRPPGGPPLAGMSSSYTLRNGGRFVAPAISTKSLIAAAYGLQPWQVVNDVEWLTTARFAITATTSTEISREEFVVRAPALMRALLADRFRLKAHMERRPLPALALMVARQDRRLGPQIRPSGVDCEALRNSQQSPPSVMPPRPSLTERRPCGVNLAPGVIVAGALSMNGLADALTNRTEQVVVNRTDLSGRFDLDLFWSSEPLRTGDAGGSATSAWPNEKPVLSVAIQEQLGLKLVSRPELLDVLVIDHIERPSEN